MRFILCVQKQKEEAVVPSGLDCEIDNPLTPNLTLPTSDEGSFSEGPKTPVIAEENVAPSLIEIKGTDTRYCFCEA